MNVLDFLKNKAVKNAGWMVGEKIIQMLISLVVSLLTARYLGPSNYGLINYATSFTAFFAAFCTLGINSLLVKEFVDRPDEEGMVLGTALILRIISSLLSAITIVAIVCIIDRDEPTTILVVALCSLGMVFHVFNTFNFWFQRHLKAKFIAVATFVAYVVTAVYRVVLMASGQHVTWFALATSVDYLCLAALLVWFYKREKGAGLSFSWQYGKQLLSRSKHYILSGLMVAIYGQTDKLMLKQMLDLGETGFYSTATAINNMWCFVLAAIIDSIYPSVMEAHKAGNEELFKRKNRLMYAIVFYVSMAAAVGFNIFAELIIYILYGKAYLPAAMPLRIVSWYTAFSYLGVARNAWIVSKNQQKHLIKIYASAAIGNVILNALLIPWWGANGAATASLIAQILTGMVIPFFIKDLRENAILMLEGIFLKDYFKNRRQKHKADLKK